eukprot:scaffold230323_cov78-Cyclotella_meneghiniana.AAC.1
MGCQGNVHKGARAGEPYVCKWFKLGHIDQASFFDLDIKAMDKVHNLVKEWNSKQMIDNIVVVNIMRVDTYIRTINSRYDTAVENLRIQVFSEKSVLHD